MIRRALVSAALAALILAAPAGAAVNDADVVAKRLDGVAQKGRALGSPRAPVTLTYFHELKCPFCLEVERRVLPSLIQREVRRKKLRIVAQPMAFIGKDSPRAARMALALGRQNLYWNFNELFYANQQDEATEYATQSYLRELAAAIPGADVEAAVAFADSAAAAAALVKSETLADKLGISGTPTLLLTRTGDRLADASRPVDVFSKSVIRREIKRLLRRR